jgi:hypothetical protein
MKHIELLKNVKIKGPYCTVSLGFIFTHSLLFSWLDDTFPGFLNLVSVFR